jgi:hypothetical protein
MSLGSRVRRNFTPRLLLSILAERSNRESAQRYYTLGKAPTSLQSIAGGGGPDPGAWGLDGGVGTFNSSRARRRFKTGPFGSVRANGFLTSSVCDGAQREHIPSASEDLLGSVSNQAAVDQGPFPGGRLQTRKPELASHE